MEAPLDVALSGHRTLAIRTADHGSVDSTATAFPREAPDMRHGLARRSRATLTALAATALATALTLAVSTPAQAKPAATVAVQVLAFNDFHGNLQPPSGSSGSIITPGPNGTTVSVPAGGVEYLATHLKNARVGHPNSITVAAGDLVGASPLLSAAFHDEPTV